MNCISVELVSVRWLLVFEHVGLKFSFPNGAVVVFANVPGFGVVRQSLAEFGAGRRIKSRLVNTPDPVATLARAEGALGTTYDLMRWNCEHFVLCALGAEPISPQLRAAGTSIVAGLLVAHLVQAER